MLFVNCGIWVKLYILVAYGERKMLVPIPRSNYSIIPLSHHGFLPAHVLSSVQRTSNGKSAPPGFWIASQVGLSHFMRRRIPLYVSIIPGYASTYKLSIALIVTRNCRTLTPIAFTVRPYKIC